ncbi:hypothetical protein HXX76_009399 [Chlamydomonas incerta]|uniref:Uncharacterized protein n=1 Tax=Chlamydomonas incerta TaxID=51695 RepID=A0A835VZS1_CHLIN|nr:hypothetical protein HXX76_009399 [Chlamydomonas incerta]|eukprot:KAG2431908.1 hypothetical protein HXX76_009399 [Chlamydomonas incerta]
MLTGFLLSRQFQCAVQLTVGMFVICLFTFVSKMRFLLSCLSATLYVVCSVLVSQDGHVGAKLLGCAMVCAAVLWGSTLAGCALSLALVVGEPGTSGHTAFLCCLSAALLAVLVVNRMGANPPFLWVIGMVSCLSYGITTILGQPVKDRAALWREVVGHFQLAMAVGAGTAAAVGVAVLRTLAADEMRARVAEAVRGTGAAIARYASAAFKPDAEPSPAVCSPPACGVNGGDGKDSNGKPPQPRPSAAKLSADDATADGHDVTDAAAAAAAIAANAAAATVAAGGGTPDTSNQTLGSAVAAGTAGVVEVEILMSGVGTEFNDDDYLQLLRHMTAPAPPLPREGTGSAHDTAGSKHGSRKGDSESAQAAAAGDGSATSTRALAAEAEAVRIACADDGSGGEPQLVAALRPLLARARMCIGTAALEPPLFLASPINPPAWGRVVGAAEELLARVAALEGVVGDGCGLQIMADASLTCYFEVDIVPYFRRAYGQVAATCATLADAITHRARGGEAAARAVCGPGLLGSGWQQTKQQLREAVEREFRGYWGRVRAAAAAGGGVGQGDEKGRSQLLQADVHQMRGIAFMWTLTNSLIDAMEGLERAVAAAHGIALPPPLQAPPPHAPQQQATAGAAAVPAVSVAAPQAAGQAVAEGVEAAGVGGTGDEEALKPPPAAPIPPAAAPPEQSTPLPWLQRNFGWAWQLMLVALGLPLVGNLVRTLAAEVPALRSGAGWRALLRSRVFQAGAKYWACLVTVLLLILGLSERGDTGYVAAYRLAYAYEAAALAMTERVEATVSQVSLWVVGTAVGGTLGYLAMLDADLATNPYGLMAIICAYTFLVGCASAHTYRMGIVFTLMAMASLILCQYRGCCGATGSVELYAARVLMVMAGCSVPVLLSNLVLPWYTSDWALETLGGAFLAACRLVRSYYAAYYNDGLRAHAATYGAEAAAAVCAQHGAPSQPIPICTASGPHPDHQTPPGVPHQEGPPPTPLLALVSGPLTAVQVSLENDTTLWRRGLLATPPVVFSVLRGSQALLDRLAALALMAEAAPAVSGGFSGWAFEHIVVPLYGDTMYVFEALDAMAAAAAAQLQLLSGGAASQDQAEAAAEAVGAAVEELHRRRLQMRGHVLRRRAAYHVGVMSASEDHLPRMTNPDDALRVFSFMFALIQVANKATALARTIGAHRRCSVGVLGRAHSAWWR